MAAQGVGVVLDPDGGGLGGAQGVDAEQVGEGAVVDGDGLGDLQEPDQLEPVQALGAGLVAVDLRQPGVDGRVGADEAVDVGEPEVAADGVQPAATVDAQTPHMRCAPRRSSRLRRGELGLKPTSDGIASGAAHSLRTRMARGRDMPGRPAAT